MDRRKTFRLGLAFAIGSALTFGVVVLVGLALAGRTNREAEQRVVAAVWPDAGPAEKIAITVGR